MHAVYAQITGNAPWLGTLHEQRAYSLKAPSRRLPPLAGIALLLLSLKFRKWAARV